MSSYKAAEELDHNPQVTRSASSTCASESKRPAEGAKNGGKVRKEIVKAIVKKSTDPGKITVTKARQPNSNIKITFRGALQPIANLSFFQSSQRTSLMMLVKSSAISSRLGLARIKTGT